MCNCQGLSVNLYSQNQEFTIMSKISNRPDPNAAFPNPNLPRLCFIKNVVKNPRLQNIKKFLNLNLKNIIIYFQTNSTL